MADTDATNIGMLLDDNELPESMARVVSAHTLLGELDKRCKKARSSGGRSYPVAVGWVQLDETVAHRNQLGFTGLERLMRGIHERIRSQLEPKDITARLGINGIALLIDPQEGDRDHSALASELLRSINSNLFEFGKQMVAASVSIAIRPANEHRRIPEANMVGVARMAEALTTAGGNRCEVAAAEVRESTSDSGDLLGQLTKALRDNSLRVVFQPLLATSGPETSRFQALPRLIDADGTLIPAARFVPVAAARGVLPALDQWMIAHVLGLIRDQGNRGDDPAWYFVNQSPALIEDPRFMAWFRNELDRLAPNQRRLVVEFNIIELKARLREAREALAKIRELGVGVSLSGIDERVPEAIMLKHIPCDFLRMKADFARRVLADKQLADRFQSFAQAAHAADRKLVVPMLEDAEAVSRIWQMDVDLIQGNFIQQPSEEQGA